MRYPNTMKAKFPIKQVLATCSIEPDVCSVIRNMVKTGKRGRPATMVRGTDVMKLLTKQKAYTALAFFKKSV